MCRQPKQPEPQPPMPPAAALPVAIPVYEAIPVEEPAPVEDSPAVVPAAEPTAETAEPAVPELRYRKHGRRYISDPKGSYHRTMQGRRVRFVLVEATAAIA